MIDLRSDTMTIPTKDMLQAVSNARFGDDVYGEDPSVNELQEYVAAFLGKEDALFVPSGTMGNQICVHIHTNPGDEIIMEEQAHIFYYETAASALLSGIQIKPLPSFHGIMNPMHVLKSIRPDVYYFPKTTLICIENTHNRHSGAVTPLKNIENIKQIADEHNIALHCDGARLWNAATALNIAPKEIAKYFDSLSVCLSKGLGAPVGSVIVGKKEFIQKALKFRKILGGGVRQAGILASAGLFAIKNNYSKLAEDHFNAKEFAFILSELKFINIEPEFIETNIVIFNLSDKINSDDFCKECKNKGLLLNSVGNNSIRCVFYYQISYQEMLAASEIIKDVLLNLSRK